MPQPLYLQIADDLAQQIKSGDLSPGNQLPTEDDLRGQYRASRNTIRDAIKRLIGQGLVETRPGQGTFVTIKVDPFVTVLTGEPDIAGVEEASYLSEVSASRRKPAITKPKVEIQNGVGGDYQTASGAVGHTARQQARAALHRRPSLVGADILLSHGVRLQRCRSVADGGGHHTGSCTLPGRNHRAQADRLPGLGSRPADQTPTSSDSFGFRTTPPFSRYSAPASTSTRNRCGSR